MRCRQADAYGVLGTPQAHHSTAGEYWDGEAICPLRDDASKRKFLEDMFSGGRILDLRLLRFHIRPSHPHFNNSSEV